MRACIAIAILTSACATGPAAIDPFVQDLKADGHKHKLHPIDDHKLHVDEPSDLVFANDQLYTVSDAHSKIYAISRTGDVEGEIDITGKDLEALAFDAARGEFLVADESNAKIWHIDAAGGRRDPIEIPSADDGNSGIEGITFDDAGHLLVGKEKDPARIYEVDGAVVIDHQKLGWIADLSALSWHDGALYVLSDQDRALYQLDADYHPVLGWHLPIDKPEGLAFEGTLAYIASDSEERLYVFDLADEL